MKSLFRSSLLVLALLSLPVTIATAKPRPAPEPDAVVTINDVRYPVFTTESLKPLKTKRPIYPKEARRDEVQGNALVVVLVDPAGMPREVSLKLSEPTPAFGEAALAAVKQWKFRPYVWNGEPAAYIIQVPVAFRFAD
ncbi:energy transducer TonB [Synoicihabitans lomoniglobus]|uniref:Energy transducer TonB n=1 Tax=Synoicihabitans lomoniglobus TaxID=2909285 RepID=A0AAE9ZX93_9BACT|nr:energy transducer TonB [Opitutaceae bacterium LMO-M01]WED64769.1 energy transducer TonB [Opitutaceae bacterium LMO-M01]